MGQNLGGEEGDGVEWVRNWERWREINWKGWGETGGTGRGGMGWNRMEDPVVHQDHTRASQLEWNLQKRIRDVGVLQEPQEILKVGISPQC